ncbi:MAG: protein phosphatase 2C domain-containing protein [Thermoguttaceae bacterium]
MPQSSPWKKCLENAALSDLGLRRANNQDSFTGFLAGNQQDYIRRGHLFMVADGMGAHAAGELASKIATDVVPLTYQKLRDKSPPDALLAAVLDANNQIYTRGQASPEFKGMGTTSTVLVLLPQGALLAHVGDSRAYRVRGQTIDQLTFDHSLVWELQASGQKYEEPISNFIGKNIITRSLGPNPNVQVDLEGPHPCLPGDTFLLCSDGLTGQVQDAEIGAVLVCLPPAEAVQALVDLANLRGGPDNTTVICARVLDRQMAQDAGGRPATAAGDQNLRRVHPLAWAISTVAFLAAIGLCAIGQWATAFLLLAVVIPGIMTLSRRSRRIDKIPSFDGRHFGRGPYVSCDCAPDDKFIVKLIEIINQLRDAAVGENWKIDWDRFNQFLASADDARNSADYVASAREYLRAISFMMAELKHQHPHGDS